MNYPNPFTDDPITTGVKHMEKITLEDTIKEMTAAYMSLEESKCDCKSVVNAVLDAYEEHNPDVSKEDRKAIIKLAKATAKMNQDGAKDEAVQMVKLCDSLGI
jgi:hypothetical protein